MSVLDLDRLELTKFLSRHIEYVTCLECCKYYIAPERAKCGHALCHSCWRGRHTCPECALSLERRALKLDKPLQSLTSHIRELVEAYETLFSVKMEDFALDIPAAEKENDTSKHVKEWLTSSDNHFSAPPFSDTQQSTQDILPIVQLSTSKIQIHTETNKSTNAHKKVHVSEPQVDWDKIEVLPDTEEITEKTKQNAVGPMDIEPFYIDENDYSNEHPRRSNRKKDKPELFKKFEEKSNTHNSSGETDKKTEKSKQTWTNVKKMKKEFSKLNKLNKNKLNISIEMCKKQSVNKQSPILQNEENSDQIIIDENTPSVIDNANKNAVEVQLPIKDAYQNSESILNKKSVSASNDQQKNKEEDMEIDVNSNDDVVNNRKEENTDKKKSSQAEVNKIDELKTKNEAVVKIPFTKSHQLQDANKIHIENEVKTVNNVPITIPSSNSDDIHISIRIGDVVTNITICKKQNDVQLKVNTDREVQTSHGTDVQIQTDNALQENNAVKFATPKSFASKKAVLVSEKSASTKKNTASAETATVQYEITESVEKELSKIMECDEENDNEVAPTKTQKSGKSNKSIKHTPDLSVHEKDQSDQIHNIPENLDLDDIDIFNSGSIKEQVKMLKDTSNEPSEIIAFTNKTYKSKTQKIADKRNRCDNDDDDLMPSKRVKLNETDDNDVSQIKAVEKSKVDDESPNYDEFMGQVFANIDEDIRSQKGKNTQNDKDTSKASQIIKSSTKILSQAKSQVNIVGPKDSENMFSTIGHALEKGHTHKAGIETQADIDNLLTPGMCENLVSDVDNEEMEVATPQMVESDESVVEETPQKDKSTTRSKADSSTKTVISANKMQLNKPNAPKSTVLTANIQNPNSVINLTDTIRESSANKDEVITAKSTETPLTINRFVNQIKHNSTPMARKSLNFSKEDENDTTICPTNNISIGKTTQERVFMSEAFEQPNSPVRKPFVARNVIENTVKFCLAGSCLTNAEITNVKILCYKKKWTFNEKYSKDLTHLIVGIDEEGKAQRSVKYMCALAAGKWIVSSKWVEKCLELNQYVREDPYEALDSTGDPGPRRSRTSKRRVFEGITFYCLPPFSVLDVNTFMDMLVSSGGRVVKEMSQIRVSANNPSILMAEPEHTQDDKFIYLTMKLNIVPVNYEWALNCLGSYSLCSLYDQLLCPPSLLPKETSTWPQELLAVDD